MTEVTIKYNPYKLETEITIDGEIPKEDSKLSIKPDTRLQTWVEELPERLRKECNSTKVKLTFHGTTLDYEDVVGVAANSKNEGIEIECEHEPAKEAGDKIAEINSLFEDIKDKLFVADEKASDEYKKRVKDAKSMVEKAFKQAGDDKFEVAVIATMSSGKSTLINALLHQKIMPAKQEACTAIITRITDNDDSKFFEASAYDKDGEQVGATRILDNIKVMEVLNDNAQVCRVEVEGNIPFVSAEDTRLVLVDTPGPNSARDPDHKEKTCKMLEDSTKTLVLYIMNGQQLAINDDNELLTFVSEQTKVGGKQSKDRFIFVINKLDDFKTEDGDNVDKAIENVKKYLENKGIEDPNIYPVSARYALNIRHLIEIPGEMDKQDRKWTELMVEQFNDIEQFHFETKSQLTPSAKDEIESQLDAAKKADKGVKEAKEALIHTGIIPIENAIKAFVEKYAKSAKIKNLVDTFNKELESAKVLEEINEKIDTDEEARKQVLAEIEVIKKKLDDGQVAKEFANEIDGFDYNKEIKDILKKERVKAQAKLSTALEKIFSTKKELTVKEAESLCRNFVKFGDDMQAVLLVTLDKEVVSHFRDTASKLQATYLKKLNKLSEEIESVSGSGIPIISLKEMMAGDVKENVDVSDIISSLTKVEDIYGDVKNTSKKWWNPVTWFAPGWVREKVDEREYVRTDQLTEGMMGTLDQQLDNNFKACAEYSKMHTDGIKIYFKGEFCKLDSIIKLKTSELERRASDRKDIDARIKSSKKRLTWIKDVQKSVEAILEI